MNELYEILSEIADTYHIAITGNPEAAILYALYAKDETEHESGEALGEIVRYRIAILMQEYQDGLVENVRNALKNAGWKLSGVSQYWNGERERYIYELNATKWREITND